MDMKPPAGARDARLAVIQHIAATVAAVHADDVDANSRFPHETFAALREAGLLSAAVPVELGGAGCDLRELASHCATLAGACSASGMILAMHHIQVGCIVNHGMASEFFRGYLRDGLVRDQQLIGSVTSEVGTFGDTRTSVCAVEVDGDRFTLTKDATTVSYGAHSDALLVTCRRAADAAGSDQVLVLLAPGDFTLENPTSWDTLGMRGTCSQGYKVVSSGRAEQILPGSYADSSAQSMVPYSHILWSALWSGIAGDAVARAGAFVRQQARQKPGSVPPTAVKLAEVSTQLQTMRQQWMSLADEYDALIATPAGREKLLTIGWALKMNQLKVASSEMAPQIVHKALQIVGILGYKNDSKFSVGRHYRDVLSASLMVSNDRVAAKSAAMLLVFKDD